LGILTRFSDGFDRVLHVLAVVASALFFFIVVGVTLDVTGRYFFGLPILWMSELVSYCPLFIAFLTSAWLLKNERHVKMDVVYNHLRPKHQLVLDIVTSCFATIIFFVVTWYTGLATWNSIVRRTYLTTELNPPKYLILFIIPLGSFLIIIQLLRRIKNYLGKLKALQGEK